MTSETLAKGKEYLEKAIEIDPDYALAYAGMAEFYFGSSFWGFMHPEVALPNIKAAAMEALNRDDMLAEAHAMLGISKGIGDFDWPGAEREYRRAVELNPASPAVRYYYGFWFLRPVGRVDEALAQVKRAMELDPLSSLYNTIVAYLYYASGQYDFALAQYQRAIDLDPAWYPAHWLLAMTYQHLKKVEEGLLEAQKACELSGRNAITLGILGLGYGLVGRDGEARAVLEELTAQSRTAYVPSYAMAAVCRGLGEMEHALAWLEKGVEKRDMIVVTGLKTDPRYIALHSYPRYHALLRKMNLET